MTFLFSRDPLSRCEKRLDRWSRPDIDFDTCVFRILSQVLRFRDSRRLTKAWILHGHDFWIFEIRKNTLGSLADSSCTILGASNLFEYSDQLESNFLWKEFFLNFFYQLKRDFPKFLPRNWRIKGTLVYKSFFFKLHLTFLHLKSTTWITINLFIQIHYDKFSELISIITQEAFLIIFYNIHIWFSE